MKKSYWIIAVVIVLAYILYKKSKGQSIITKSSKSIKLGDKGKDVQALQEGINNLLHKDEVKESGMYDTPTKEYVDKLFVGSPAYNNGAVDVQFIKSLKVVSENTLKVLYPEKPVE